MYKTLSFGGTSFRFIGLWWYTPSGSVGVPFRRTSVPYRPIDKGRLCGQYIHFFGSTHRSCQLRRLLKSGSVVD